MSVINDERLQEVVRSLYYDNDNNLHSGIFETCDDAWLLVNVNVLEKLLYDGVVVSRLDIEDAEELYGDDIIQRYLARQEQNHAVNKLNNMSKANSIHKNNADMRKLRIIAMIIDGSTKAEVEKSLNISRNTVNRALKGLDKHYLQEIFNQYKDTVFSEVSGNSLKDFISVDCSYSKYRKLLQSR